MSAMYQQNFAQHAPQISPEQQFPPTLAQLQPGHATIVAESFGFMAGTVGLGALIGGVWFAVLASEKIDENFFYAVAAAVCGLVLMIYEVYRRIGPTTLARIGNHYGIYRKGHLNAVVTRMNISDYRLSTLNTIRYLIVPALVTLAGSCGTIGTAGKMGFETLASATALLFGGLVLASLIRTRVLGLHYYVPEGRGSEEVVLMKADAKRLFDFI